jgi:uncharacterized membrane protein
VWVNHHVMFDHVLGAGRTVLLLNTVLLMVVAFLPFATRFSPRHCAADTAGEPPSRSTASRSQ